MKDAAMCDQLQMVVLSYFHAIIGPSALCVHPPNGAPDSVIKEINCLIDKLSGPGFFTWTSGESTIVSQFFEIPSNWARGAKEMVLLSFFLPGNVTPDVRLALQHVGEDFEAKFRATPDVFKGFHATEEARYPEEEWPSIRLMYQKIANWTIDIYGTAKKSLITNWVSRTLGTMDFTTVELHVMRMYLKDTGPAILSAVNGGAKTRQEIMDYCDLSPQTVARYLSFLLAWDLLTEGSELVLTNRGRIYLNVVTKTQVDDPLSELEETLIYVGLGEKGIKILLAIAKLPDSSPNAMMHAITMQFGKEGRFFVRMFSESEFITIGTDVKLTPYGKKVADYYEKRLSN